MKLKSTLAIGLLALTACGGTKTVYVVNTDAPDTTVKQVATTDAPVRTPVRTTPPVYYTAEDEFLFDIESSYGPILISEATVIEVGYATCEFLRGGGTKQDLLWAMESSIVSSGGDANFVVAVVASAVVNFCPEQAWKIA